MNKGKFKGEFINELMFFGSIAKRDKGNLFTTEQVEDELVNYASAFYNARLDFDEYAEKKIDYVKTFAYQISKGRIDEIELDQLYDEYEEEKKVSGIKH